MSENPFEAYDIDPRDGPRAITERFRELLEDATTDEERERLRAAWEELTLHPAQRVRAAFGAHPAGTPSRTFAIRDSRFAICDLGPAPPSPPPFRDDPILFPKKNTRE